MCLSRYRFISRFGCLLLSYVSSISFVDFKTFTKTKKMISILHEENEGSVSPFFIANI